MRSSHLLIQKRPVEPIKPKDKCSNFMRRAISGMLMVSFFSVLVALGPVALISLIFVLQLLVFKEVISVAHKRSRDRHIPWFRTTTWYTCKCNSSRLLLTATLIFLYGDSLSQYSQVNELLPRPILMLAARSTAFFFYVAGLILFIVNLKFGHYKFQFSQLATTILSLLFIVVQSHFSIKSLREGIVWYELDTNFVRFVLPVSFVVFNDVAAYFFGKMFGRTRLLRVSPNKTVEGYVGGTVGTLLFAWLVVPLVSDSPYMLCPLSDLRESILTPPTCDLALYGKNLRLHFMMIALFASIIAPFGGFLASGFKRAFKVKDFAESIPGHGGFADRMDCQFLMGLFTYLYLHNFVKAWPSPFEKVLKLAQSLPHEQQIRLGVQLLYDR